MEQEEEEEDNSGLEKEETLHHQLCYEIFLLDFNFASVTYTILQPTKFPAFVPQKEKERNREKREIREKDKINRPRNGGESPSKKKERENKDGRQENKEKVDRKKFV